MNTFLLDVGVAAASIGLVVTALSSIVSIWIQRDDRKPRRWAVLLSLLVLMAAFGSLGEILASARESARLEADMARILERLDELAAESEDPALTEFVANEVQAQQRSNPRVVNRLAGRMESRGRDSKKALGRYLDPADLEKVEAEGGGGRGRGSGASGNRGNDGNRGNEGGSRGNDGDRGNDGNRGNSGGNRGGGNSGGNRGSGR